MKANNSVGVAKGGTAGSEHAASTARTPVVVPTHTAIKGRARLKIAGLHRSEHLKHSLEAGASRIAGLKSLCASSLTGNALVVYEPTLSLAHVIRMIETLVETASRVPCSASWPPHTALASSDAALFDLAQARARLRPRQTPAAPLLAGRPSTPWHCLEAEEVLSSVGTGKEQGLPSVVCARRLEQYGPNVLPRPAPRSGLAMFASQFASLPVALLAGSALVSVATGGLVDAAVIMAVVFINATIGYVTESRAERTIRALDKSAPRSAFVVRDALVRQIPADTVVIGDLLVLTPGTYVAADARVVEVRQLTVDESALTGESMPVHKCVERESSPEIPLAERANIAYMGTVVTGGSGLAVVVGTGVATELGAIQTLVSGTRRPQTPMQWQLQRLGNQLVLLSGAVCALVFGVGLLRGLGLLQMVKAAISLAVAAVPEGLPTVATTTLALGIANMRRRKVLMRRLDAVETLGAVQTICFDKTGTVTVNRMAVLALHVDMRRIDVADGTFYSAEGKVDPFSSEELMRLLHAAALCNEVEIVGTNAAYTLNGSATESALMHLALTAGVSVEKLRERHPRIKVSYRAENRKYMCTLHEVASGVDPARLLAVKGNPADVLALCGRHIVDGEPRELTFTDRSVILDANNRLAGEALRVLGFAYATGAADMTVEPADLCWLGLAGMADPVRHGVKDLIPVFHRAGIRTVMITGDQSATACAIGKQLGLSAGRPLEALDLTHLGNMEANTLAARVRNADVFARVSPADKLQIVQGLQRAGQVVAMTGDGVNDGPALKAANIGVAMGRGGTDVARDIADVVLEDDDLRTMIVAISEGRTIYNNIRKSIHFLVSTNLSEILVMLASIGAGLGQPLNPMQLLWINLLTDVFPALALAMEPSEPDVLIRPPRDPHESIIRPRDLKRYGMESAAISLGALASYGLATIRHGIGPRAGTVAFMTLTFGQLLHAYSCRSESRGIFAASGQPRNPYLDAAIGSTAAMQLGALTVPALRGLLGTTPINLADAVSIVAGATLPFVINEATKAGGSRERGGAPMRFVT